MAEHLSASPSSGGVRVAGPPSSPVWRAAGTSAIAATRALEYARLNQDWLEAAAEVSTALLSGSPADEGLRLTARHAWELSGADSSLVALACTGARSGIRIHACAGPGLPAGTPVPADDPVVAPVLYTDAPAAVPDFEDAGRGLARLLPGYGPALAVPFPAGASASGALVALRRRGAPAFPAIQEPLMTAFARRCAAHLAQAAEQRARREHDLVSDRDRIARDLHDQVIQRLFAIGLALQSTLRQVPDPAVHDRVYHAVREIDATVRDIRSAIFDLHAPPMATQRPSLRRRLIDIVASAGRGCGVQPIVRLSGAIDTAVPDGHAEHAEAVVREAVTNALRHARARRITVEVDASDSLTVDVTDDGVGVAAGAARSGLCNLRERASECGGTLDLAGRDGGGTWLRWRVPLG